MFTKIGSLPIKKEGLASRHLCNSDRNQNSMHRFLEVKISKRKLSEVVN